MGEDGMGEDAMGEDAMGEVGMGDRWITSISPLESVFIFLAAQPCPHTCQLSPAPMLDSLTHLTLAA